MAFRQRKHDDKRPVPDARLEATVSGRVQLLLLPGAGQQLPALRGSPRA